MRTRRPASSRSTTIGWPSIDERSTAYVMTSFALGGGELRGPLDPQLHARAVGDGAQRDAARVLADECADGVVFATACDDKERLRDVRQEAGGDADALHAIGTLDGDGQMAARLLQVLGPEERGRVTVRPDTQQGKADACAGSQQGAQAAF